MTGDQQKDALEERQKEIDEALATSDACWRMEQEVLQRQLDEARAEVERLRAEGAASYTFRGGYVEDASGDRWWSAALLKKVEAERDEARRERDEALSRVAAEAGKDLAAWARDLDAAEAAHARVVAERDEARAEIERLRGDAGLNHWLRRLMRERDEARAEVKRLRNDLARWREVQKATAEGWRHEVAEVASIIGAPAHTAELAACVRAEVERLRARVRSVDRSTAYEGKAFSNGESSQEDLAIVASERDAARAEVERLRAEIEMLRGIGCREAKLDEPESGPCGVCLKCAEERGARWALERHGNPFATKTLAQYAEDICRDARGSDDR